MYKSQLAVLVLNEQDKNINTEWLDLVTFDTDSGEITIDDNLNLTKGFVRGLIAVNTVDSQILNDIGL